MERLKKYEEAIECYEKALEIDPNDGNAWFFKGLALENFEKYDEAIACYERALEIDPKDKDAWINKKEALEKLKKNSSTTLPEN